MSTSTASKSKEKPGRVATSQDKGHGRRERRELRTTPSLTVNQKWKGLKQGFRLTRERTIGGQKTVEVIHGITSLSMDRANAAALLKYVRDHWRIENQLHYVRDVTLREDACRVRSGSAPQILAALRNSVVHLLAQVEAERKVRILFASESGSRAWGFASQDSDYDVRFLYVHSRDWYLSIEDRRDVIEEPISEGLDISAHGERAYDL